ncbi:MAG TPA: TatD family hydrolase [Fervidobacterium sp.]|nr:TatD family hydrolase [Fervidobacterium sp.]HQI10187.1 TatD family hydrolase [Fervidobacterium sp.]
MYTLNSGNNVKILVDTHAHLHMNQFDTDRDDVLKRASTLELVINVSTSLSDIDDTIKIANLCGNTFAAIGIHPHDSKDVGNDYLDIIQKKIDIQKRGKRIIAIGEIGLDYFRNMSPIDTQKKVFAEQLMLAQENDLPVILHIRDAYEDAYDILKTVGIPEKRGIVHSFSSDENWAKKFVKLGFKLGIGGPITYPKNDLLRSVVKIVGVENIVTETDCPYLPPQQYRGKRNEPIYVSYVVDTLNGIFECDISTIVFENALQLFGLTKIGGAGLR